MRRTGTVLSVAAATLVAALMASATPVAAQRLAPKRTLAASGPAGCSAFPAPVSVVATPPTDDPETRRLIEEGQEAALQGEHASAREAFTKALARAPGQARVAYYLARTEEALGDTAAAVREYCRYLALAAGAPDAGDVRERIGRLVPVAALARLDQARASFRSGLALLERRAFRAADSVFGAVNEVLPGTPEVFFNRALARTGMGARTAAVDDLERYLELTPLAADRAEVRAAMLRLQERVFSPGRAFGAGIAFPGMGQMSTGRPVLGVVVLGAVGTAVTLGLTKHETTEERTFTDPFGNPYVDRLPRVERKNLAVAAGAAAAVWLGAAVEAMLFARHSRASGESLIDLGDAPSQGTGLVVAPASGGGVRVGVRIIR